MYPATRIGTLGFRRWYERKLIEAHAYFITCFLCMIMAAVSLEGIELRTMTIKSFPMLMLVFAGVVVAIHTYNRFRVLLAEAERYAEHSVCPKCDAYGVFSVIASGEMRAEDAGGRREVWLKVRCKKCHHEWSLP
jgi:hypothetical protein